jgi:UPF0755 protein
VRIKLLITVTLLILALTSAAVWQFKQLPLQRISIEQPRLFLVQSGIGLKKLCQQWQTIALVDSCLGLEILAKLDPSLTDLKAGMYQLRPGTVLENVRRINQGDAHLFSFTIIEGQTLYQIIDKIAAAPYLSVPNFIFELDELEAALNFTGDHLEGWLYPETYYYRANETAISLLKRASSKMKTYLQQAWERRAENLPYANAYEALIMASIIEKETGIASERPLIASVFINRLNKKMRLQTDPTVIYGLGEAFDGDIKRSHLKQLTPFNTYMINGLPPTPIASPSAAAIDAALNPLQSDYYYFVAKGDGSHQFSKTLSEHNAAVRKYQLKK